MISGLHPAALFNRLFSINFRGPVFRSLDLIASILFVALGFYFESWITMILGALGMVFWIFNPIVWASTKLRGYFVKPPTTR